MMLVSTPTKHYMTHRNSSCDRNMSPSYHRHYTPPRLSTDSQSYDSPMLTPSPLRQHSLFPKNYALSDTQDPDDLFLQSPYKLAAQAHPFQSYSTLKPQPIPADDDEGSIFRASPSRAFSPFDLSSSSQPLRTPVKQGHHPPNRNALSVVDMNGISSTMPPLSVNPVTRVGVGTKRKSTPLATPLRHHALTPLKVAPSTGGCSAVPFDRLAPLPAPKFTTQTPQSKADTEAFLRKQTATLTRLRITNDSDEEFGVDNDSGCEMDEDDGNALFLSNATMGGKGRLSGSLGKVTGRVLSIQASKARDKEEVVEAVSPGGHVNKRRARSRPVSAELLEQSLKLPKSPSRHPTVINRSRYSDSVAFPSASRGSNSPGSSSSETGSPLPRRRISATASSLGRRSLGVQIPLSASNRPPLCRIESASLFFGPPIPPPQTKPPTTRSRTNSSLPLAPQPRAARSKNRHSYAGSGNNNGLFHAWTTMQTKAVSPSPGSSPASLVVGNTSLPSPEQDDEEIFFGGAQDSSFVFKLTEDTPSPKSKKPLPRKCTLRDSGIVVSDEDEMAQTSDDHLHVMLRASTSVSSMSSDIDEGLITPGIAPESLSGWPSTVFVQGSDDSVINSKQDRLDVDSFIMRTLEAGSKGPGIEPKKVPGTPVKKIRTTYLTGERPWQSAVAAKTGLRDECDFKKMPRKSLPAAFAPLSKRTHKGSSDSTESEGEEDSPIMRRDRYTGLGLGRPPPPGKETSAIPRSRLLMRRSSSGAFSSGTDSASMSSTPTRVNGAEWQLPNPRIPVQYSPSDNQLKLCSDRSTSGSSSGSTPTLNSPTNGTRHLPVSGQRRPVSRPSSIVRRRSSEPFAEEQPGRFEREFVEVDEVGSGQFGKVIKVRRKIANGAEFSAIKKSKRFEGAKHRLRLREEVDILKHLSQAAQSAGLQGSHPNVLAYIDSWEEDEALYIQTELCESGNLARFLWEYGRVFPRLDEARVWKIVVDLTNGLRFIHDAGVIHLDLKPSNVFVTKDGRFKIGDFGMASLWPRSSNHALGASIGGFEREGDKLYLAPEVLQGKYGKAADIFSFGMTILETASNIVVPDQGEAWHRLRREDFSQVDLDESPELLDLTRWMMRTDPSQRITVHDIYEHPIVSRTRIAMERMFSAATRDGTGVFAASPLASVPDGFLDEILARVNSDSAAMDVCS